MSALSSSDSRISSVACGVGGEGGGKRADAMAEDEGDQKITLHEI